jgi:hypothetical protein
MPGAHFGHPVVFAAFDLGDREFKGPVAAEWWPWAPATGKRFFHLEENRRTTVVRCEPDCSTVYPEPPPDIGIGWSPMFSLDTGREPCSVWAAIINGYDSDEDTFSKDTEGMYAVLRGMGVPEWCICYLTDDPGATEGDAPARPNNVTFALQYIADRTTTGGDPLASATIETKGKKVCGADALDRAPGKSDSADDFLLFVSSHGSNGVGLGIKPSFRCNNFKTGGGDIFSDTLAGLLQDVNADRMTVVMEACYSGSFYDDLKTLPNASFFFSADKLLKSFGDRDPPTYPDDNPGDAGSESIWGFIEAFGTGAADGILPATAPDGDISFAEAVEYAQQTDATKLAGGAPRSIIQPAPPVAANPLKFLESFSPATTLNLQLPPFATSATAIRCQSNQFGYSLSNNHATNDLMIGALRFHVEEPGDAGVNDWDHADTVIVPNLGASTTRTFAFNWRVPSRFQAGSTIHLVASIDSPQNPVGIDPNQIEKTSVTIQNPSNTFLPCGCTACTGCR